MGRTGQKKQKRNAARVNCLIGYTAFQPLRMTGELANGLVTQEVTYDSLWTANDCNLWTCLSLKSRFSLRAIGHGQPTDPSLFPKLLLFAVCLLRLAPGRGKVTSRGLKLVALVSSWFCIILHLTI